MEVPAADSERTLAVLRQAPFGDVHAPGDLGGLDQGIAAGLVDESPVDQAAVDPKAHVEAVIAGLEVQVGGPRGHRLAHQLGEDVVRVRGGPVAPCLLEKPEDLPAGSDLQPHLAMGKIGAGLAGAVGGRILDRDMQLPSVLQVGQDAFLPRLLEGDEPSGRAVERPGAEAGQRQPVAPGDQFGELPGGGEPERLEDGGEALARVGAPVLLGARQLLGADRPRLGKGAAEPEWIGGRAVHALGDDLRREEDDQFAAGARFRRRAERPAQERNVPEERHLLRLGARTRRR